MQWGRFAFQADAFWLEDEKVSRNTEENRYGKQRADRGERWLRAPNRPAFEKLDIEKDSVGRGCRKKQCGQSVETQCGGEISMEKGREGSGSAAARTLQMEKFLERTLGIETVLPGRKAENDSNNEAESCR